MADDDLGVGLEQADDLIARRHRLAVENAPLGLVQHPIETRQDRFDVVGETARCGLGCKRGRRQTLRGGSLRARLNGPARVDAWRLGCRKVMADQAAGAAV